MSSAKWRLFCLGLNELMDLGQHHAKPNGLAECQASLGVVTAKWTKMMQGCNAAYWVLNTYNIHISMHMYNVYAYYILLYDHSWHKPDTNIIHTTW